VIKAPLLHVKFGCGRGVHEPKLENLVKISVSRPTWATIYTNQTHFGMEDHNKSSISH